MGIIIPELGMHVTASLVAGRPKRVDGESFVALFSVVNDTARPVSLPWQPDPTEVTAGPDAPMLSVSLNLDVQSSDSRSRVPVAVLYGSTINPADMKILEPGGKVEILARGNWPSRDAAAAVSSPSLARRVKVGARLVFQTSVNGSSLSDVISSEGLGVNLGAGLGRNSGEWRSDSTVRPTLVAKRFLPQRRRCLSTGRIVGCPSIAG